MLDNDTKLLLGLNVTVTRSSTKLELECLGTRLSKLYGDMVVAIGRHGCC